WRTHTASWASRIIYATANKRECCDSFPVCRMRSSFSLVRFTATPISVHRACCRQQCRYASILDCFLPDRLRELKVTLSRWQWVGWLVLTQRDLPSATNWWKLQHAVQRELLHTTFRMRRQQTSNR